MKLKQKYEEGFEPDVEPVERRLIVTDEREPAIVPIEANPGWEKLHGPCVRADGPTKPAICERCGNLIFIAHDYEGWYVLCNECVTKSQPGWDESRNENEWIDEWREQEQRRIEGVMAPLPRGGYTG